MLIANTEINDVCVIDDSPEARESWCYAIEDAKLNPVQQNEKVVNLDDYLPFLKKFDAIVTDHHLKTGNYFPVNGAEIVYKSYDFRIPSILVTRHDDGKSIDEIRQYRAKIPVLLSQEDYDPDTLKRGLEVCINEFKGKILEERELYRTLIKVDDEDEKFVYVIVPGWNPHKVISIQKNILDTNFVKNLSPKAKVFARANIGAHETIDLYFTDWEV